MANSNRHGGKVKKSASRGKASRGGGGEGANGGDDGRCKAQQRATAGRRNAGMNGMARCGAASVVLLTVGAADALAEPQAFPSPEAAVQALRDALEADAGGFCGRSSARNTPTI